MQTVTSAAPEAVERRVSALDALRRHWPEYLMEAAALGAFMISACVFTVLLEHPMSPIQPSVNTQNRPAVIT
jgi:hypothetical protein